MDLDEWLPVLPEKPDSPEKDDCCRSNQFLEDLENAMGKGHSKEAFNLLNEKRLYDKKHGLEMEDWLAVLFRDLAKFVKKAKEELGDILGDGKNGNGKNGNGKNGDGKKPKNKNKRKVGERGNGDNPGGLADIKINPEL